MHVKDIIIIIRRRIVTSAGIPSIHLQNQPTQSWLGEGGSHQHPAANMATEKRLSARRKHTLKSCMLMVANTLLDTEATAKAQEREKFLAEACPPLDLPYSRDELLELCKKLHEQIGISEEERYSAEFKLNMVLNEVRDLNIKIVDLRGKFKRPRLKKVRMSADAMLKALLGSKHTVNMDLRANLKQVKKEVKEEDKQLRDVGDWRKNIEDKSDRKKMFDS
uniref:Troponin I, fast skeletal muscle n=1 Tax=Oryzias latipes TaxID=8090 RepID=A0A3P9LSX1_ORYLA